MKISEFKCQKRGGIGVRCLKFRKTVKGDHVTDSVITDKESDILIISKSGTMCRQKVSAISTQRRESQGVKIMKLDDKDLVVAMSKVMDGPEEVAELGV